LLQSLIAAWIFHFPASRGEAVEETLMTSPYWNWYEALRKVGVMPELEFAQLSNEDDPATCRGRAVHARMAADESTDQGLKRIFQRLAELYEAKAGKLERELARAEQPTELVQSGDASEPPSDKLDATDGALVAPDSPDN